MARRRRRGRRMAAKHHFGGIIGKLITPASFIAAFVPQIAGKDINNNPSFQTLAPMEKAKFLSNSIMGRTTGINPFPQYGTSSFTLNPAGTLNKYTGMGVGLMILSEVLPRGFGGKSISRKVGKGLFWGGIVGGLFDDPKSLPPNPSQQIGSVYSKTSAGRYTGKTTAADASIISAEL